MYREIEHVSSAPFRICRLVEPSANRLNENLANAAVFPIRDEDRFKLLTNENLRAVSGKPPKMVKPEGEPPVKGRRPDLVDGLSARVSRCFRRE